ncbi:MAG: LpxL/LpxP family Kdo(2)-lipid IV(A) lauroyl/palmitoleoyl acyltransferase [Pseudohongiellaceae bacterium]
MLLSSETLFASSALSDSLSKSRPVPLRQYIAPRYWPVWLGVGFMWLVARLPFALQMRVGQGIGWLGYWLARERRHVCGVNLRLCFPELSEVERRRLIRRNFISSGIGLVEAVLTWTRYPHSYRERVRVTGLENLQQARAKGKGVLLVSAHFTTLEIGGFLLSLFEPFSVTYRPNRNPLLDALILNGRLLHYNKVIPRHDVRPAIRSLKAGDILWYAPDQDYGPKHSVFAPFFGVPAATITATSRFVRATGAAVVFFSHYRNGDNSGYDLYFSEPLENYPSGDDEQDARRINELIEAAISKQPEQYLWLHKRFKTYPASKETGPY